MITCTLSSFDSAQRGRYSKFIANVTSCGRLPPPGCSHLPSRLSTLVQFNTNNDRLMVIAASFVSSRVGFAVALTPSGHA